MYVDINWIAVVIAAFSSMVVGSLWYAEGVFGKTWMKLVHLDKKKANEGAARAIAVTFLVSLITAFVLAHIIFLSHSYFNHSWMQDALTTSIWLWLGFTAARFITHDAFEGRPEKLTLINVSHELVTLVVMGFFIGLLHP